MALSQGASPETAEDVVQDMYLRLNKYVKNPERIMYGKEVNTFFVFRTIRNLVLNEFRDNAKRTHITTSLQAGAEDVNYDEQASFTALNDKIWESTDNWHWYDKKLFTIYHTTDNTIRSLSEDTNISERSIWNTLDNCRTKIKEDCKKEYEEWKRTGRHD
jgi:RNA polymerase sigma factor (sigma-70 family)